MPCRRNENVSEIWPWEHEQTNKKRINEEIQKKKVNQATLLLAMQIICRIEHDTVVYAIYLIADIFSFTFVCLIEQQPPVGE